MQTTETNLQLITPLSVAGSCRQYREALPEASAELCGAQGVSVAVGFTTQYIVYRGTFDAKTNTGSWNFSYIWNK